MAMKPRITGMPTGRPKVEIPKDALIALYEKNNCNWQMVADELGVTKRTIQNRLKEYNITKRYYFGQ